MAETKKPPKPKCAPRTGYTDAELEYQLTLFRQFVAVPYVCPHCQLHHLMFVNG